MEKNDPAAYEAAAAQLSEWTNAHKNFEHSIFLALFDYREGRTNEAVQAVFTAVNQPFVEAYDNGGDTITLGDNGALIASSGGHYDLCLSMCDKVLADTTKDPWGRPLVGRTQQRIKAAALFMKGDESAAMPLMKQIVEDEKHDNVVVQEDVSSDEALLSAMREKNTKFVMDMRNWVTRTVTWFSPFQFSNVEYGSAVVHDLYPASWRFANRRKRSATHCKWKRRTRAGVG